MKRDEAVKLFPILGKFNWADDTELPFEFYLDKSKATNKLKQALGVDSHRYEEKASMPVPKWVYNVFTYLLAALPIEEAAEISNGFNQESMYELFIKGQLKSGAKLSKYLLKNFYSEQGIRRCMSTEITWDINKLPGLPSDWDKIRDYQVILKSTFEYISSNEDIFIGVGWDFETFFNSLSSTAYSSCMKINSLNSGYLHILPHILNLSERAVMIYIRNATTILGRSLVLLQEDYSSYCVKPIYGVLTKQQREVGLDWMMRSLTDKPWYINKVGRQAAPVFKSFAPILYYDEHEIEGTTVIKDNVIIYNADISLNRTLFECPSCKQEIHYEQFSGLVCKDCYEKNLTTCLICGVKTDNGDYCKHCVKRMWSGTCSICSKTNVTFFGVQQVCIDCFLNHSCSLCTNPTNASLVEYDGMKICTNCEQEISTYIACRFCGDTNAQMRNGRMMCDKCLSVLFSILIHTRYHHGDRFCTATTSKNSRQYLNGTTDRDHWYFYIKKDSVANSLHIKGKLLEPYFEFLGSTPWISYYAVDEHRYNVRTFRDGILSGLRQATKFVEKTSAKKTNKTKVPVNDDGVPVPPLGGLNIAIDDNYIRYQRYVEYMEMEEHGEYIMEYDEWLDDQDDL